MVNPLAIILQILCIAYQDFFSYACFIHTDLNVYGHVLAIIHKYSSLCNNPVLQINLKLKVASALLRFFFFKELLITFSIVSKVNENEKLALLTCEK